MLPAMARKDGVYLPSPQSVVGQPSAGESEHQLLQTSVPESHCSANVCHSCVPLSLVQAHWNPESDPARVVLVKS